MALEIYVNDEKLDLASEAVIALTKQVADIKKLAAIKSDFSNTITVPITDKNRRILQNSQVLVSSTELPYQRIPVSVYQDGVQLITYGFGVIDEAGDSYKLVIYNGNIDWTTALGTLRLEDIDTTDVLHEWDLATITDSHVYPGKIVYCYPPVVTGQYDPSSVNFTQAYMPPNFFDVAFMRPYMFMSKIMERIFEESGYTLEGELLTDTRYINTVVECSRFDWSKKWYVGRYIYNTTTKTCQRVNTGGGPRLGILRFVDETNDLLATSALPFKVFQQGVTPVAEQFTEFNNLSKPGRYRFRLTIALEVYTTVIANGINYPPSSVQYVLQSTYPMTMVNGSSSIINNNTTVVLECDVEIPDLLVSGYQRFWIKSTAPINPGGIDAFSFRLGPGTRLEVLDWFGSGKLTYTDVVNLAYNLPDMTQLDFVKTVCNMFGVAPVLEVEDRIVRLVPWNNVEALKPYALDWSAKYDTSKPTPIKPRLDGWARENQFNYTPDTDGFVVTRFGDTDVMIADEWLPESRVAVQLPFAATQTNAEGWPFALRSLTEYDPTNFQQDTHWDREGPGRVLLVSWDPGTIELAMPTVGVPSFTTVNQYQRADFIQSTGIGLDWASNLLPDYYTFVSSFITQPKLVTCELMLTPVDVQQFNPFVPVYISKLSAFFFVNKINNWVKGKTCKVELIRI